MMLKPQDVLVACKLASIADDDHWKYARLAKSLFISLGAAHNAVKHLKAAAILFERGGLGYVSRKRLVDFLVYGAPVMLFPVRSGLARGMPTMFHAPGLAPSAPKFEGTGVDLPTVWTGSFGKVQGEALEPIYETAPRAAAADARLHDLLALVDAVRAGKGRVKRAAAELLEVRVLGEDRPSEVAT